MDYVERRGNSFYGSNDRVHNILSVHTPMHTSIYIQLKPVSNARSISALEGNII